MGVSFRELSKKQAQDGVTVSPADVLDRQVQDLLDAYNGLIPRHMTRHWTQSVIVMGQDCSEPVLALQDQLPWMRARNDTTRTVGGVAPAQGYQNVYRVKGSVNPYIDYDDANTDTQYVSTVSFAITDPAAIQAVSLFLRTDLTFGNSFTWYGANRPPDKLLNEPLDDLVLEIAVDSPFDPERRASNASVFKRRRFLAQAELFTENAIPVGATDMTPDFPGSLADFNALAIDARHLGILLPRDSRVRLSVVIPEYRAGFNENGWVESGTRPWGSATMSGSVVLLEPTVG